MRELQGEAREPRLGLLAAPALVSCPYSLECVEEFSEVGQEFMGNSSPLASVAESAELGGVICPPSSKEVALLTRCPSFLFSSAFAYLLANPARPSLLGLEAYAKRQTLSTHRPPAVATLPKPRRG
jgi:hypothetical protein